MMRIAVVALGLVSPAAYEPVPNYEACAASIEIVHDLSEQVGETSDGLAFLLDRRVPEIVAIAEAMAQAERLIDTGDRQLQTLITSCGGGVLDWAADLRGALGDLRASIEIGRLRLPAVAVRRLRPNDAKAEVSRVGSQRAPD